MAGTLIVGNAWNVLQTLTVEGGIDLCITSPPYWGVRDYDNEEQIGHEPHYNMYLRELCQIFEQVKPHFKPQSNLMVNIGDCYFSRSKGTGGPSKKQDSNKGSRFKPLKLPNIMPIGAQVNIPARFAVMMVDKYHWILKHTIIWHKPNAMPTSNKKKFTPDFEYLYHFVLDTKKYFFEQQFEPFVEDTDTLYRKKLRANKEYNVKDPYKKNTPYKHDTAKITSQDSPNRMWEDSESLERQLEKGRNKRSVWSITTKGYHGSHAATYPRELIETPIAALCPEGGVILDPFMGAGTTAIEAEAQDKYWIGIELNEEYYEDAIRRIKDERTRND